MSGSIKLHDVARALPNEAALARRNYRTGFVERTIFFLLKAVFQGMVLVPL